MKFKLILVSLAVGVALGIGAVVSLSPKADKGSRIDLSGAAVVVRIQELGRLETSSYTIEKIIEAGTDKGALRDFLFGDKLLLVAHGEVVAGVDLAKIGESDVRVDDKAVRVTLPKPEVLHVRLDNEKTRVFDRKQGILGRPDKDLESEARLAAEVAIKDAACGAGVLGAAAENAMKQVRSLLTALGFTDVIVDIPPAQC